MPVIIILYHSSLALYSSVEGLGTSFLGDPIITA